MLYLLGLAMALIVRPDFGLYTYMAVLYVHPPSRWWGDALPDIRWSLVAAAVTLLAVYVHRSGSRERPPWYSSTIARILILYTIWMWIQAPWVISPSHLDGVVLFTKYCVLFFLIYEIVDSEDKLFNFALVHVLGCAYLGLLIYLAPDSGRLDGIGGPGIDNANALAMQLGTGLIFASFMILRKRNWQRWAALAAIPFILNGIIQTETRGAIAGLLVAGVATIYLKPNRFRRQYYVLAVLGLLAVGAIASKPFLDRLASATAAAQGEEEWDNSAQTRVALFEAQLRMLKDYPLGAGHQGTATLSTRYLEERWLARNSGDRASHNTVMSIAVDQGLPGLILLTILVAAVFRALIQSKRLDKKGLPDGLALYRAMVGGALITAIVSGMFTQFLKAEIQIWCFALVAVLYRLNAEYHAAASNAEHLPGTARRAEIRSRHGKSLAVR